MQIHNEFTVPASLEHAWEVLSDLDQVVPCLPGASLDTRDDDQFSGRVTIKLGPMRLGYRGEGVLKSEPAAHRIVVDARGNEQRGGGSAAATITASLAALSESSTRVRVDTDLQLTGKPAQFGRGILTDVSTRIIGSLADNLAARIDSGQAAGPSAGSSDHATLDVMAFVAAPLLWRGLTAAAGVAVIAAISVIGIRVLRHRRA